MRMRIYTRDDGPEIVREGAAMVTRPNTVHLLKVDGPVAVESREGTLAGTGYVAHDPVSGGVWLVAADYVAANYVPAQGAATETQSDRMAAMAQRCNDLTREVSALKRQLMAAEARAVEVEGALAAALPPHADLATYVDALGAIVATCRARELSEYALNMIEKGEREQTRARYNRAIAEAVAVAVRRDMDAQALTAQKEMALANGE